MFNNLFIYCVRFCFIAVMNIIALLSDNDLISLVIISEEAETIQLSSERYGNNGNGVLSVTQEAKEEIFDLLNSMELSRSVTTNHSMAFDYAFQKIAHLEKTEFIDTKQQPIQFVYVTHGLHVGNLSETGRVLTVIANGQNELKQPITINTCLVALGNT